MLIVQKLIVKNKSTQQYIIINRYLKIINRQYSGWDYLQIASGKQNKYSSFYLDNLYTV